MGRTVHGVGLALAVLALAAVPAQAAKPVKPLQKVKHIVVIYEENHSFDNLYGGWEGVNGPRATPTPRTRRRSTRTARRSPACRRTTST